MRGTKAKRLRKQIYGDTSLRVERSYIRQSGRYYRGGGIINHPDSPRAKYQAAKRQGG
jgi:hypothetical protein